VNVQQVSRELGVKYVLEGSVRRSGNQLRNTAQLIDATTGNHLWAERYDREMKDVFAIQDEITLKVMKALLQLTGGQQLGRLGGHTKNLQAYLKLLEGIGYNYASKFGEAMKLFEEALSLDPQCPETYGWLAWTQMMNVWFGPSPTRSQSLERAFQFAEKCKALDQTLSGCSNLLGHAYLLKREYDKALSEGKRAVELDPNSATSASMFGWTLRSVGRYEDAIKEYERSLRLDPLATGFTLTQMGTTYLMMRRYEESISSCKKALEGNFGNLPAHLTLAMAYGASGKEDEARGAASDVLKISPNFSVEHFAKALPFKNEADIDFIADALRKAGLK
jgi:adenylate cyclase